MLSGTFTAFSAKIFLFTISTLYTHSDFFPARRDVLKLFRHEKRGFLGIFEDGDLRFFTLLYIL